MATLTARKVLKYTLLPGFWPRLRDLFTSGFKHVAYTMAMVYQAVRLLPPDHPYLNPENFGRFGIRHVIGEAANNLVFKWKNFDQIVIFFTILVGMMLLLTQCVLFVVAVIYQQPAFAAGIFANNQIIGVGSNFGHGATGGPGQDIAFIILDRVFGLQGIYNSCVSMPGIQCLDLSGNPAPDPGGNYPLPFHLALHTLLRFYSMGIFMVSVIVILYFVMTVIGETAVTGSPFGQRFNKTWAPVRLILFFALLVPLNNERNTGLNSAQLLTFMSAKLGSNFATNAWGRFNGALTTTYLGEPVTLVSTPNQPSINPLVQFMFVAKTCKITEEYAYGHEPDGVQAYLVRATQGGAGGGNNSMLLDGATYDAAAAFNNNGTIEIRFGVRDEEEYKLEKGYVKPLCGILKFQTVSVDPGKNLGSYNMQRVYFDMLKEMWRDAQITQNARCVRDRVMQIEHDPNCATWPNYDFARNALVTWENYIRTRIPAVINDQVANSKWGVTPRLRQAGWAGAAIWYNRIAQINGDITTSILNLPQGFKYPFVMETVANQNKMQNENVNPKDAYDPALGGEKESEYLRFRDRSIAAVLYNAFSFWNRTDASKPGGGDQSGISFVDTISFIFGVNGIQSMRDNNNIHPLAKLSSLGKGMMEASIRNLAVGLAAGGVGSFFSNFSLGAMTAAAGDFIMTMGKITIVMSFILFYVLPFLPFIYFMFAVSGWIKSIFEAVVAMPLWALSHISRLDGNGIMGPGANNGYFLLLEIFLRPILILFGLIASLTIFAASVNVLNDVFDMVKNVSGFDTQAELSGAGPSEIAYYRGPIDEFFFSAIYVVICYMMALGYFKMVDQVPNNILRWMGVSVSTFSEAAGDPASTLTGKVYAGGSVALGQIKGGGQLAALFGGPGGR